MLGPRGIVAGFAALLIASTCAAIAHAAPVWIEQGPGAILNEVNVEGIPNGPAAGAINAIAADPANADVVYVGSVNGGIWKTTNATAANPTWTPQTDRNFPALSINSIAMSPLDPDVVYAGTGTTSADAFEGSEGFGIARTTNGGTSWTLLAKNTFAGMQINSVVPTSLLSGKVVLVANLWQNGGVYRSVNKGSAFTRLSGDGVSGLPDQGVSSLVGDPGNTSRFYAAVPQKSVGPGGTGTTTGSEGVYKSTDGGLTWTVVNTGLSGLGTSGRILLAVHNNSVLSTNAVYAMVIGNDGHFTGGFRSLDQGTSWSSIGFPSPGIFPGAQGTPHGAIVADPADVNTVFIAGDRQASPFPNANGCNAFSANVVRVNASTSTWENAVCSGAGGTSPHADSRGMVFDSAGNLLFASDGGIYKLTSPNVAATRQWSSINGNVRTAELHSVAYDPVSNVVFGGTQDNGTPIQPAPGSFSLSEFSDGDGGVVAVDADQTAHAGQSIRYTTSQFFGGFSRSTWDSANNLVSGPSLLGLNITSGVCNGATLFQCDSLRFYNPYVLNAIDPSRMLIGTVFIFESLDKGDHLSDVSGYLSQYTTALAYGSRLAGADKPDAFYVGTTNCCGGLPTPRVLHRVNVGDPLTTLTAYPGSNVLSVVMDPQNYKHVFVLDDTGSVWASLDEGVTWVDFTSNLAHLLDDVSVIEIFNPGGTIDQSVLIAGGLGGVVELKQPLTTLKPKWAKLSKGLPKGAFVQDLHYDYTDNVLVAATLGRGAWTLTGFFPGGTVAAASLNAAWPSQAEPQASPRGWPVNPPIPSEVRRPGQ